jgi:nicotinamide-nucleotide amidase
MSQFVITKSVIKRLTKLNKTLSVAESITAGGIAEQLTRVPGSSKVLHIVTRLKYPSFQSSNLI